MSRPDPIVLRLSPMKAMCPDFTPSGTFPKLTGGNNSTGLITSDAYGVIHYMRAGQALPNPMVPTPFWQGAWNFSGYDTGGVDYAGNCAANYMYFIVTGDGTLTIPTLIGDGGGPDCLTAELFYYDPILVADVLVETQYGVAGDTFTFHISTDVMTHCSNWVRIREQTPEEKAITGCSAACGHGAWGFAGGVTWELV